MATETDIKKSYLSIRKTIGILGFLLPLIILISHGEFLPSISHYYYTKGAVFFISILSAFGLFLISYKGYKSQGKEISDNLITIFGGICVLVVVLIPTSCGQIIGPELIEMCKNNDFPIYGHDSRLLGTIHLISAGLFLFSMGWMSLFRFTRSNSHTLIYKICGVLVWASIAILMLEFLLNFHITIYDVYIIETVAVIAFGTSWLIKGEVLESLGFVKDKA